jgi:mannitol-1-phosphate/altronate dehydrogenase
MTAIKYQLAQETQDVLLRLPYEKVQEVKSFAEYLLNRYEETLLQKGIQQLAMQSAAFDFLKDEPDLYTMEDLRENFIK